MKKVLLISLVLVLGLAVNVWADIIAVDEAYWTGSRTTNDGGIIAYDGWAWTDDTTDAYKGFKISWVITQTGGVYNYSYTLSDLNGGTLTKFPSHLILEVSEDFASDIVTGSDIPAEKVLGPQDWTEHEGNPYMPGSIWGIKLDVGLMTYSFSTDVAPIWGDFYSKDGNLEGVTAVAYNSGIGTDPTLTTTDFTNWIAVPDTESAPPPIPEPSTLLLIGTGLLGLGLSARGRFRK
jgi:hypothetical protein